MASAFVRIWRLLKLFVSLTIVLCYFFATQAACLCRADSLRALTKEFHKEVGSASQETIFWYKHFQITKTTSNYLYLYTNSRNITLLNSTHKLFTKILADKISNQISISEHQQGLRRNRSTVDAIFILWQTIEKSI